MQNMTESPLHLTQSKHCKKFNFRLESMMQLGLCIYISTLIKKWVGLSILSNVPQIQLGAEFSPKIFM